jgi:endonuclease/exonuclease/phosphatase family metal-dependent hydrolase
MTWNIRTGVGNHPDNPHGRTSSDLNRIAEVIREIDPDIVAMQEVDRDRDRTGYVDQTAILAETLGMDGRFAANLVDEAGEYGIATFSRFPILNSRHDRFISPEGWEPRGVLEVVVDTGGSVPVTILNTHLQIGLQGNENDARRQRHDSAEILMRRVGQLRGSAILMGDFNAEPVSPELKPLARLTDVWVEGGDGGTGKTIPASPFVEPNARIDVIFVNESLRVRRSCVVRNHVTALASDHYPVVSELVIVE